MQLSLALFSNQKNRDFFFSQFVTGKCVFIYLFVSVQPAGQIYFHCNQIQVLTSDVLKRVNTKIPEFSLHLLHSMNHFYANLLKLYSINLQYQCISSPFFEFQWHILREFQTSSAKTVIGFNNCLLQTEVTALRMENFIFSLIFSSFTLTRNTLLSQQAEI